MVERFDLGSCQSEEKCCLWRLSEAQGNVGLCGRFAVGVCVHRTLQFTIALLPLT